jgi:hypothetical protein
MSATVAIIDYGSGNLHSAAKAFERAAREAGPRRHGGRHRREREVRPAAGGPAGDELDLGRAGIGPR